MPRSCIHNSRIMLFVAEGSSSVYTLQHDNFVCEHASFPCLRHTHTHPEDGRSLCHTKYNQ